MSLIVKSILLALIWTSIQVKACRTIETKEIGICAGEYIFEHSRVYKEDTDVVICCVDEINPNIGARAMEYLYNSNEIESNTVYNPSEMKNYFCSVSADNSIRKPLYFRGDKFLCEFKGKNIVVDWNKGQSKFAMDLCKKFPSHMKSLQKGEDEYIGCCLDNKLKNSVAPLIVKIADNITLTCPANFHPVYGSTKDYPVYKPLSLPTFNYSMGYYGGGVYDSLNLTCTSNSDPCVAKCMHRLVFNNNSRVQRDTEISFPHITECDCSDMGTYLPYEETYAFYGNQSIKYEILAKGTTDLSIFTLNVTQKNSPGEGCYGSFKQNTTIFQPEKPLNSSMIDSLYNIRGYEGIFRLTKPTNCGDNLPLLQRSHDECSIKCFQEFYVNTDRILNITSFLDVPGCNCQMYSGYNFFGVNIIRFLYTLNRNYIAPSNSLNKLYLDPHPYGNCIGEYTRLNINVTHYYLGDREVRSFVPRKKYYAINRVISTQEIQVRKTSSSSTRIESTQTSSTLVQLLSTSLPSYLPTKYGTDNIRCSNVQANYDCAVRCAKNYEASFNLNHLQLIPMQLNECDCELVRLKYTNDVKTEASLVHNGKTYTIKSTQYLNVIEILIRTSDYLCSGTLIKRAEVPINLPSISTSTLSTQPTETQIIINKRSAILEQIDIAYLDNILYTKLETKNSGIENYQINIKILFSSLLISLILVFNLII